MPFNMIPIIVGESVFSKKSGTRAVITGGESYKEWRVKNITPQSNL